MARSTIWALGLLMMGYSIRRTRIVRPPWARLKHCDRRGVWLFLVPERVFLPCPITVDILQRIERPQSLSAIPEVIQAAGVT